MYARKAVENGYSSYYCRVACILDDYPRRTCVVVLSVCLSMLKLTCSKLIHSTNNTAYLTHNKDVRFSVILLRCRARVLPALYDYTSQPFSIRSAFILLWLSLIGGLDHWA